VLKQEIADRFFAAVVKQAHLRRYISGEHFSVDGTLLEAWASHKSFRPKDDDSKGGPPAMGRNPEWTTTGSDGATRPPLDTDPRRGWRARELGGGQAQLRGHLLIGKPERADRGHGAERATGYASARRR